MITRVQEPVAVAPRGRGRIGGRLADTAIALRDVGARPPLRRAELAYGLACTSDAAFTVTLGVVVFREVELPRSGWWPCCGCCRPRQGRLFSPPTPTACGASGSSVVVSVVRAAALAATAVLLAAGAPV